MDADFAEQLRPWLETFVALAGAAAGLLGLTFIMMSLRREIFDRPEAADVRAWRAFAVMTLGNFFTILIIALLGLVPTMNETSFGVSLGVLGLLGCVWLARLGVLNSALPPSSDPAEPWRWVNYAAIFAAYGGLVVIGAALLLGHQDVLNSLFAAIIALLALGVFGSWILLTHDNAHDADPHHPNDAGPVSEKKEPS